MTSNPASLDANIQALLRLVPGPSRLAAQLLLAPICEALRLEPPDFHVPAVPGKRGPTPKDPVTDRSWLVAAPDGTTALVNVAEACQLLSLAERSARSLTSGGRVYQKAVRGETWRLSRTAQTAPQPQPHQNLERYLTWLGEPNQRRRF